ncbi:undecaprenyldiphospho-muramoylpentapeptide beta-N-acetylglucosaminyltransferase [bacterium]|nr:MAG: undecaprenyldiphospho-muramoylpentapeptide beta-N-acetylglucosaminyltransferase [bacterium]
MARDRRSTAVHLVRRQLADGQPGLCRAHPQRGLRSPRQRGHSLLGCTRRGRRLKVAFAGGGTGGHVYPALALAQALKERDPGAEIRFFGMSDGIEARLVAAAGYPFEAVPGAPLERKLSLATLRTAAVNVAALAIAFSKLASFKPQVLIATGGYVSLPVVWAAWLQRPLSHTRIVLLEPNAAPGLTNRLAAPLADEVWGAYADAAQVFGGKFQMTGVPVRPEVRRLRPKDVARKALGLDPARPTLLAIGGSQGARKINQTLASLVTRRALDGWQVIHVTGARDYEWMQAEEHDLAPGNSVALLPYLDDMALGYAAADLVVARAGASTLAELAATGTASILVPYPFAAENHQARNAEVFTRAGAAVTIADNEVDGDRLWWTLVELRAPGKLEAMRAAARGLARDDAERALVERLLKGSALPEEV